MSRSFQILDQSVSNQSNFFDRLILVKDIKTGEEGTLLCSHMCQWPKNLFDKATWIEGCKTPIEYQDDSRLAMGFHPDQYTQWKVDKQTNTIELYLTGGWTQHWEDAGDEQGDMGYVCNLPYVNQNHWISDFEDPLNKDLKRLLKIYCRKMNQSGTQAALDFIESVTHRLLNNEKISPEVATALAFYICFEHLDEMIHWGGNRNVFTEIPCEGGFRIYQCSSLMYCGDNDGDY